MKQNSGIKFLIVILVIVAIIAGILLALKVIQDQQTSSENLQGNQQENVIPQPEEPVKTVQTFSGNERAIALMIDNHEDAWPQGRIKRCRFSI